ncbi:hypothetical protein F4801DRAFT_419176 [Xylaria longipes]|nr:hypothetical protein F4801DRAFT_419176 [Xylaria longipes]
MAPIRDPHQRPSSPRPDFQLGRVLLVDSPTSSQIAKPHSCCRLGLGLLASASAESQRAVVAGQNNETNGHASSVLPKSPDLPLPYRKRHSRRASVQPQIWATSGEILSTKDLFAALFASFFVVCAVYYTTVVHCRTLVLSCRMFSVSRNAQLTLLLWYRTAYLTMVYVGIHCTTFEGSLALLA